MSKCIRVYADGVFDLFHYGHAAVLEQAKKSFPDECVYLMVGVNKDEDTHMYKGKTVMSYEERCKCVASCRWVDEVIYDAPWEITKEFMDKHKIDFVAHDGDPYPTPNVTDIYYVPKSMNKFLATKRADGISTTDLINRIMNNVQEFQERNEKKM